MNFQCPEEHDKDTEAAERLKKWLFACVTSGAVVAAIFVGLYFYQFHGTLASKVDDWAAFGDFIGGTLNPWFSFLAIIALLGTISLQVTELRLTKAELAKSAWALQRQCETLDKQAFESTFFQLLNHYVGFVERTTIKMHRLASIKVSDQRYVGVDCYFLRFTEFTTMVERGDFNIE